MHIYLHRLRENGWSIPKYQFTFKPPLEGELTVHEQRYLALNRAAPAL